MPTSCGRKAWNETVKGYIFDIKRFAVHDGPGIRTTVFFKGCPLKCVWCHNPEGLSFGPRLAYYENKCLGCGECAAVCPRGAHTMEGGSHRFRRELCTDCGLCADACPGNALVLYGREISAEELLAILRKDRDFYENSGGGVTLSGGECLMQADFCAELLKALKQENIRTAVDTSGFVPREALDKVMPFTDMFLYDIKAMDSSLHKKCTGVPNDRILSNLRYIDSAGIRTEIRIPLVPGFNDDQPEKIAAFVRELRSVTGVKVLPYHNYAGSKYSALGYENKLPGCLPDKEQIRKAAAFFG